MSELTSSWRRATPRIALAALLAAGCGDSTVREDVFPNLNCGKDPDNRHTVTYYLSAGELALFGHPESAFDGVKSDATATVNDTGTVVVSKGSSESADPTIQALPTGNGVSVESGDEHFTVTSSGSTAPYPVTIMGSCAPES